MRDIPDKYFELAIVDPPYGIGVFTYDKRTDPHKGRMKNIKNYNDNYEWNDNIPGQKYFDELYRISENQIIWGAIYYNCFNGGAVVWYKGNMTKKISHCEIASLSFQKKIDYIHINYQSGFYRKNKEGSQIHPCQKPIALYRWLLQNYAKPGDKIFDSHVGSGSSLIACIEEGHDYVGCEIDPDYYRDACKRIEIHQSQGRMF